MKGLQSIRLPLGTSLRFQKGFWFVICSMAVFGSQACGPSGSKTPDYLVPGTTLTIKGSFLNSDGSAYAKKRLRFQNLRVKGFIDENASYRQNFVTLLGAEFMLAAFPLFTPFYLLTYGKNNLAVDPKKVEEKPNAYLASLVTDTQGAYEFKIKVQELYKDVDGNININISNEPDSSDQFLKNTFVVKDRESKLDPTALCESSGVVVTPSGTTQWEFSWKSPITSVVRYHLRIAEKSSQALVWFQEFSATTFSATLSDTLFQGKPMYVALEAIYEDGSDRRRSCMSKPVEFAPKKADALVSTGALVTSPQMGFKLTQLTDGQFLNRPLLEAFDVQELQMDLKEVKNVGNMHFHNLFLNQNDTITLEYSLDDLNWTVAVAQIPTLRFLNVTLPTPISARYLKLVLGGSTRIKDLQEWAVWGTQ